METRCKPLLCALVLVGLVAADPSAYAGDSESCTGDPHYSVSYSYARSTGYGLTVALLDSRVEYYIVEVSYEGTDGQFHRVQATSHNLPASDYEAATETTRAVAYPVLPAYPDQSTDDDSKMEPTWVFLCPNGQTEGGYKECVWPDEDAVPARAVRYAWEYRQDDDQVVFDWGARSRVYNVALEPEVLAIPYRVWWDDDAPVPLAEEVPPWCSFEPSDKSVLPLSVQCIETLDPTFGTGQLEADSLLASVEGAELHEGTGMVVAYLGSPCSCTPKQPLDPTKEENGYAGTIGVLGVFAAGIPKQ